MEYVRKTAFICCASLLYCLYVTFGINHCFVAKHWCLIIMFSLSGRETIV
uniref:Uncharacterized protein n=1 Tax=Anguilla anguilla TaxID=7936 RepID=A0A0E9X983_ANGAN